MLSYGQNIMIRANHKMKRLSIGQLEFIKVPIDMWNGWNINADQELDNIIGDVSVGDIVIVLGKRMHNDANDGVCILCASGLVGWVNAIAFEACDE